MSYFVSYSSAKRCKLMLFHANGSVFLFLQKAKK
nr:MAG TPA: hypothetical protein [Caudoviricetes sp.]